MISLLLKRGLRLRFSAKTDKHDHWLDYASDKYDRQLIEDVKQVLSVIVVFMPMPVFWALYEQQVSRLLHFKEQQLRSERN